MLKLVNIFFIFIIPLFTGCAESGLVGRGLPIFPLPGKYDYSVDSDPPGANIYFNGIYKGKAPIRWSRTLLIQTIEIINIEARMEGYVDGYVVGPSYVNKPQSSKNVRVDHWGDSAIVTFTLPPLKDNSLAVKDMNQTKITPERLLSPPLIDDKPPAIYITHPIVKRGIKVVAKQETIDIRGVASDPSGVDKVIINEVEAHLTDSGVFSAQVDLFKGDNKIQVKATDTKRNISNKTFTIALNSPILIKNQLVKSIVNRNYYALLIACQDYIYNDFQDLDHPLPDAMALSKTLTSLYLFPEQNVRILKNPDRKTIINEFESLSKQLKENCNLLVFFAGHGYWDNEFQQGYWLPSDSSRMNRAEWLSNSTVRDFIRGIKTKHTLLIADACFSGGIFKTRKAFRDSTKAIQQLDKLPSRKAITSGTLNEVPDKSVFVEYLIKRLEQNISKYLSSEELFSSFRHAVINNSPMNQVPQFGEIREAGDEGGDFIFIRRK